MAKFGERIRKLRIEAGMSQEELATRMGYSSKSTITKIEQGKRDVPQNKIVKFAEALGTTPGVLMGWVDEETNNNNDAIVGIVMQLRKDEELLEIMKKISKLDPERRHAIQSVLNAMSIGDK